MSFLFKNGCDLKNIFKNSALFIIMNVAYSECQSGVKSHGNLCKCMLIGPSSSSSVLQVCCDCGCDESVFPLAVSLLDRYLASTLSLPVSPTCLSAACVLVASKLAESETVTAHALCASAEYEFLSADLLVSVKHLNEQIKQNKQRERRKNSSLID